MAVIQDTGINSLSLTCKAHALPSILYLQHPKCNLFRGKNLLSFASRHSCSVKQVLAWAELNQTLAEAAEFKGAPKILAN